MTQAGGSIQLETETQTYRLAKTQYEKLITDAGYL